MQLLFSLYKLLILPKIPFTIVLEIVEMPLNVEYPTLPLNKNVKFWQHFWAENILKVPLKGKGTWWWFDSMQIIHFTWKYMWNVNENCEKEKKNCGMWESPLLMKILVVIDEDVIGLL